MNPNPCTCPSYACAVHKPDQQALGDPKDSVHPFEQEAFLAEVEKLISQIQECTQLIGGIPHSGRTRDQIVERYRELYDERKAKILRVEEINRLCIEKGYITA